MLILKLVRENLLVCIISLKIKILLNTEIGNSNFNYAVKEIGLAWDMQANYSQICLYYNAAQGCPKTPLDLPYGSSYSTQTFPGRLSRYSRNFSWQTSGDRHRICDTQEIRIISFPLAFLPLKPNIINETME